MLLWLGPALLGIHLTEPYLALLIDKQATHLDLLKILPQLYQELVDCPGKISQISRPAFPSLKDVWIDPLSVQSPYRQEVGEAILDAINRLDENLLEKYLREMAKEMGVILKRQRGMLYHFFYEFDRRTVLFCSLRRISRVIFSDFLVPLSLYPKLFNLICFVCR